MIRTFCERCAEPMDNGGVPHFSADDCLRAMQARAERAEAVAEDYNKRVWELIAERDALRAELDEARAGWLDPDTQYPADRQPIIVLLEHEATYYTGEDDPTGDALPEFELWGYQRIIGWRPLPTAPDDGGEEK